jgi:hypothetical protein
MVKPFWMKTHGDDSDGEQENKIGIQPNKMRDGDGNHRKQE